MAKKKIVELTLIEYFDEKELGAEDRELLREAKDAGSHAYAPYSHFQVGAPLRLDSGEIIRGNNRENASFPVSICAEHTAVASAGASHPDAVITSIAICARKGDDFTLMPVSPCGKCRQVLSEEEDRTGSKIRIILYGKSKIFVAEGIDNLLPLRFNSRVLSP